MINSLLQKTDILRVIDVGARGESSLPFLELIGPQVELVGFEPDKQACEQLNAQEKNFRLFKTLPYAIGRLEANRDFYFTRLGDLSSLLKPSFETNWREPFQIKETLKVDTVPLDVLVERGELKGTFDLLKLDTQGSELEILQSGSELLKNVLCVVCETEFFEMYEGQPRFSEVETYLRELGFEVLSLNLHSAWSARHGYDLSRRKLTWCDSIFIKRDMYFDGISDKKLLDERVRKMIFLLVYWGYFGEATRIAERFLPSASGAISATYNDFRTKSRDLVWRAKMFLKTIGCIVNPSRKNRIALAKKALEIRGSDHLYFLSEIGKI